MDLQNIYYAEHPPLPCQRQKEYWFHSCTGGVYKPAIAYTARPTIDRGRLASRVNNHLHRKVVCPIRNNSLKLQYRYRVT